MLNNIMKSFVEYHRIRCLNQTRWYADTSGRMFVRRCTSNGWEPSIFRVEDVLRLVEMGEARETIFAVKRPRHTPVVPKSPKPKVVLIPYMEYARPGAVGVSGRWYTDGTNVYVRTTGLHYPTGWETSVYTIAHLTSDVKKGEMVLTGEPALGVTPPASRPAAPRKRPVNAKTAIVLLPFREYREQPRSETDQPGSGRWYTNGARVFYRHTPSEPWVSSIMTTKDLRLQVKRGLAVCTMQSVPKPEQPLTVKAGTVLRGVLQSDKTWLVVDPQPSTVLLVSLTPQAGNGRLVRKADLLPSHYTVMRGNIRIQAV